MTWSDTATPKSGWFCEGVTDLGDDRELCEMCGTQWCRFLHTMVHPDRIEPVQAGCICAGKMDGDPDAARKREAVAKRQARATEFIPEWRWAADSGNPWFKARGDWFVIVFGDRKRDDHWKYGVKHRDEMVRWGRTSYASQQEAMDAAVDAFVDCRNKYWSAQD